MILKIHLELSFQLRLLFSNNPLMEDYSDFDIFYKTLKSDKLKEKFKDLFKAVGDVLYIEFVN